ncbi:MAG: hypothetical protein AAFQ79_12110 [Pseudomonadota bacterium]
MTKRIAAMAAALATLAGPGLAQDWYGAAELSLERFTTDDDGVDEGASEQLNGQGFAGLTFSEDLYAEVDVVLSGVFSIDTPTQRGLRNGEVLVGRIGRDFGDYSIEGILGTLSVVSGNNDAPGLPSVGRTLGAVAGTYRIDDDLSAGVLIGRMDGDPLKDGPSGADAFSDLNHIVGHVDYKLNDDWVIVASAAYGTATLDQDRDDGAVRYLALEAQYAVPKAGLTAFVGLSDTRFWQDDPDDLADDDDASRISLFAGVRWTFGARGETRARDRVPLPDYLTWMAVSDGTLE